MRILDVERETSVSNLQIYLTQKEATELIKELSRLLKEPEANEHFHICSEDMDREISCSIITKTKLANLSNYTKLEQKLLQEKCINHGDRQAFLKAENQPVPLITGCMMSDPIAEKMQQGVEEGVFPGGVLLI